MPYAENVNLVVYIYNIRTDLFCHSVWSVSRNWREIIVQNKKANQRRRFYLTQLKTDAKVIYIILF